MRRSEFEAQISASLPDLWRYAWSLTRDSDAADDLVQDCLERALRKRALFHRGSSLRPWLTKIMLNIFRSQWRRDRARVSLPMDEAGEMPDPVAGPEERLELAAVWRNLESVPPEQREALMAVVVGGLSYDEAALALDIPRGTLMSRIARARAKLKTATDRPLKTNVLRRVK